MSKRVGQAGEPKLENLLRGTTAIMVTDENGSLSRRVLFLYAAGLYLLALVFLLPHAGSWDGESFFKVACSSPWDRWWDWAAAWCSIKIMLFSLSIFFLAAALGMMLKVLHRESLSKAVLVLSLGSSAGFWAGAYYLLKSVF